MSIGVVQSASVNLTTSVGSIAITLSGTTAGNTIWVGALTAENDPFQGTTGTNTYTQIGSSLTIGTLALLGHWYAHNIAGGSETVTIALQFATNQRVACICEIGQVTSSALDGFGSGSSTTGTAMTTTANASSANTIQPALMLAMGWAFTGTSLVAAGGASQVGSLAFSPTNTGGLLLVQDQTLTTTAQQSAAMTAGASTDWAMLMAIFDQAAASKKLLLQLGNQGGF